MNISVDIISDLWSLHTYSDSVEETQENRAKFLAFNDVNGPDVSQKTENPRVFIISAMNRGCNILMGVVTV